jgi:hypothetical protein
MPQSLDMVDISVVDRNGPARRGGTERHRFNLTVGPEIPINRGRKPKRPRFTLRWLALGVVVALCAGITYALTSNPPAEIGFPNPQLVAELASLRRENGLFGRPGQTGSGPPSLYASAYAFPIMRAAGVQPPAPWNPENTRAIAEQTIAADPLWGRWYLMMVEDATGKKATWNWAEGVLDAFDSTGSVDVGAATGEERSATEIAMTAAALEVAKAKRLRLDPELKQAVTGQILKATAGVEGLYLRCRAARAMEILGGPQVTRPTVNGGVSLPESVTSLEDLLNLYGAVCLDGYSPVLPDSARIQIRNLLAPLLDVRDEAVDLESYYVAMTWIAVGGTEDDLMPSAQRLAARVDPSTGLVLEEVVRLGTLETTYQVSRIANDAFPEIAGEPTITAVQRDLPRLREAGDINGLLMSAVILRRAGTPDLDLEAEAIDQFERFSSGDVARQEIGQLLQGLSLVDELGRTPPKVRVRPFYVNNREDRITAWQLLSQARNLENRQDVIKSYDAVIAELPLLLKKPDDLSVVEVHYGVLALMEVGSGARVPWTDLDAWAGSLRGCTGFAELYRPAAEANGCTVDSTAQILLVDLGPSTATRIDQTVDDGP